jgi:HAD superfamily hydrolase (TIGR01509 family)
MTPVPSRYRGVVFDFDGTLLDSMPLVVRGLAAAVEPFRLRPGRREVMASLGGPSDACLRRLLGGEEHVAAALAQYTGFLGRHEELTRLFPGARRLLDDLRQAQVRLGLWTGRERSMAVARLRALELEGHFSAVVCGDDLASHKPDPAGLLGILKQWRLAPGEALFVGDSDQDLAGARAAGVPMVAIRHDREIAAELLTHPVAALETPAEAYAWVRGAVLAKP